MADASQSALPPLPGKSSAESVRSPSFTLGSMLAYGIFGLPLAFAALPIYVHVPRLYAEGVGLSLATIGAVLLLVRLCDAVTDPVLGWASDRLGNRKLAVLLSLPLLASGMYGLLLPPETAGGGWLALMTLIVTLGFSMATINYAAWGAEAGRTPAERTRLVAFREAAALVGVMLAAGLPAVLAANEVQGIGRLFWVFVPLLLVCAAVTLWVAPPVSWRHQATCSLSASGSRPPTPGKADGHGSVNSPAQQTGQSAQTAQSAFRTPGFLLQVSGALTHRPFAWLLMVFCINGIASAIPASLVMFFVADVLQAQAGAGVFLVLYFASGALGLPLWVSLSARIGKLRAWLVSMLLAIASFVWAFGLGAGDVVAFGVICILSGIALGADLSLPAAMLADLLARDTRPDQPQGGTWFGWWNFVGKANLALAAGTALPLLAVLGYASGGHDPQGLLALSVVYALVPVVLKACACVLLWRMRYKLDFEGVLR